MADNQALVLGGVADGLGEAASHAGHDGPGRHSGLPLAFSAGRPAFPPLRRHKRLDHSLKRGFDILVALLGLILLSPIFVILALAIPLTSRGPIFFVQEREGHLGRRFRIYKFRTLHAERGDPCGVDQVVANDERVTPLGRMLRRTSLDELPQFLNILKGDMSVVGPRPHVPGMLAAGKRYGALVPYYRLRRLSRPGLTGWAQANGLRGPLPNSALARARIDHDLAYIQNFSFLLDLRIVWRTLTREIWRLGGQ